MAMAPPVDTLLERLEVGIDEVREEESALVLTDAVDLLPGLPVVVHGRVVKVIHHEADQLWVEDVAGIAPGHMVTQERATLSEQDIIQKFHDVWVPRWNKAHHVQLGQWDQICGFAERAFQPVDWTFQSWTCDRFQHAVSKKKKNFWPWS